MTNPETLGERIFFKIREQMIRKKINSVTLGKMIDKTRFAVSRNLSNIRKNISNINTIDLYLNALNIEFNFFIPEHEDIKNEEETA